MQINASDGGWQGRMLARVTAPGQYAVILESRIADVGQSGNGPGRLQTDMLITDKILVADDHTLFRRGLKLVLAKLFDGVDVVEAGDCDEALAALSEHPEIDLILLDLSMPGMEGFEGLERIREQAPEASVVMLSAYKDTAGIRDSIRRGARGYLLKSFNEDSLKHALSLILSGETFVPSSIFAEGDGVAPIIAPGAEGTEFSPDNPLSTLTKRQRDVLVLMMDGQSNKMIALNLGLLESTVKAHVKVILNKLNAANRTQAAMIGAALGLPHGSGESPTPDD